MSYYKPLRREIPRGQRYGANPGWGPNPAGGHNGDDYLSQVGEPIFAAGDGEVIHAGTFDSTYADNFGWNLNYGGNMVVLNLDGPEGPYVEYGHMDEIYVKAGQRVRAGQVIGTTGETDGGTNVITGPHLHVGCLPPNFNLNTSTYGRVNPDLYLTKYWDGGTIAPHSTELASISAEGFLMALSETEQRRILAAADRINGVIDHPTHKVLTEAHLGAIADAVVKRDLTWFGFGGGTPSEGRKTTTLETLAGWHDTGTAQLQAAVAGLTELVTQLSVAQGVTIDYSAIAKAVNDDAAARMKG